MLTPVHHLGEKKCDVENDETGVEATKRVGQKSPHLNTRRRQNKQRKRGKKRRKRFIKITPKRIKEERHTKSLSLL
jgi:hypothetical protein